VIQSVNLTVYAHVVVLVVGTTSAEDIMGAEDEVRMDLDVVSLAAGSGGEDLGTGTTSGTNTNTNSSSTNSTNSSSNPNPPIYIRRRRRRRNSSRLHPLLRRHHLKLFSPCSHLPHHRGLRPMSVKVNILPRRFSNRTCRMGLMLIKRLFRFRILHLLIQA